MFRKLIISIFLSLALFAAGGRSAFAQNSISEVISEFARTGNSLEAEYDLVVTAPGDAKINYPGKLVYQNGMFRIEGNGYQIYCNAQHIWTVDSVAKEIVREEALPLDDLVPVSGDVDNKTGLQVRKSSDGKKIRSISLKMKNGSEVNISVRSMALAASSKPASFFCFNDSLIPAGYIFTALD